MDSGTLGARAINYENIAQTLVRQKDATSLAPS